MGRVPTQARGAALALGAAVLFGVGTPYSKMLLTEVGPLTLASLLYAGAGLGLLPVVLGTALLRPRGSSEASLRPADLSLLAAAILCGSILGPGLLMLGLSRVPAATGSLLLNLEPPLTILIALLMFGEHLGPGQAGAAVLILAGSGLVIYRPGGAVSEWAGILAVALASLSWAVDTNLNQRLSLRDPVALGTIKGLIGAGCLFLLARLAGEPRPAGGPVAMGLVLGAITYGASIVLFIRGLREIGAARVAAYFATAPFVGAVAAVVVLGERLRGADLAAMGLMAAGVALLLRESHDHEHVHEEMEHDHAHAHDAHHDHEHAPGMAPAAAHAHPHRHRRLVHSHPHAPDAHHRHAHTDGEERRKGRATGGD